MTWQAFGRALKAVRSAPSASTLEKQIYELQNSNALLTGQISDLQTERLKSKKFASKYTRLWEKLKKDKEAWESKKKQM